VDQSKKRTFGVIVYREGTEILEGIRVVEGFALVFVMGYVVVAASVAAPVGRVTVRRCIAVHDLAIVYKGQAKKKYVTHAKNSKV